MVNDAGILSQITNNAHTLLRHFLFNAVLNSALCMIAILISVGVVVLIKEMTLWKRLAVLLIAAAAFVALSVAEIYAIRPIYLDYTEQSYVTVENATFLVQGEVTRQIIETNDVVVNYDGQTEYLKIENGFPKVSVDTELKGTIVYLKHSRFVVWCNVE